MSQALSALSALGYHPSEARAALSAVAEEHPGEKLDAERIIRLAFDYAQRNDINKVTVVTKANVIKTTDGKFLDLVDRGQDRSGNHMTRSPRHKITLSPSFVQPLASGARLTGAVDLAHESKIWDDIDNNPITVRKPKLLVDGRLVYDGADGHWALSVWGKNLTDRFYRTHQVVFQGADLATFGAPRTVGATLNWKY